MQQPDAEPQWQIQGAAVRKLRQLMRMTQKQLADEIGMHHTIVSKIESGRYNPGLRRISDIAAALGIPIKAIAYPKPAVRPEPRAKV